MTRKVSREPPWERMGPCPKCGVAHGTICKDTRTALPKPMKNPHKDRK